MLKSILKEQELQLIARNEQKKLEKVREQLESLNDKIPYTYLLFDLDIHDRQFTDENKKSILKEMQEYFNDETENGLLLISYPMIESFRDYTSDEDYFDRHIDKNQSKDYKRLVGERGNNTNLGKLTKKDFENRTLLNLLKVNYLLNKKKDVPLYNDFLNYIQNNCILNQQFKFIEEEKKIYVLCCALFVYISFLGKKYYTAITKKMNK